MQRSRALHGLRRCRPGRKHDGRLFSTPSSGEGPSFADFTKGVSLPNMQEPAAGENPDAAAPKARSAPRVSSLGDVAIPSSFLTKITPKPAATKDYTPSLSWIPRDQTGPSSFAARAALRQRQAQESQNRKPAPLVSDLPVNPPRTPPATSPSSTPRPSLLSRASSKAANIKVQEPRQQRPGARAGPRSGSGEKQASRRENATQKKQIEFNTRVQPTEVKTGASEEEITQSSQANSAEVEEKGVESTAIVAKGNPSLLTRRGKEPPAPPPRIDLDLKATDLTELFQAPSSSLADTLRSRRPAPTQAALRTQLALERAGGDYSRYLPPQLAVEAGGLGHLACAGLTLARRRDVALKSRQNALEVVKQATRLGDKAGSVRAP